MYLYMIQGGLIAYCEVVAPSHDQFDTLHAGNPYVRVIEIFFAGREASLFTVNLHGKPF